MHHVRYNEWIDLIGRVIARYGSNLQPRIFEIGGGTGILGEQLRRQGYRYVGSDLSFEMSRMARKRRIAFLAADGRALPVKAQFDLVIFLYDGINYLWDFSEYHRLFGEVWNCLEPNGLFLFDITTSANSLRNFRDYLDYEDFGDAYYVRHSYFDVPTKMQHNDFTIFMKVDGPGSLYERTEEHHAQRVFAASLIEKQISPEQFSILGIWDGFTFRKYSRHSERIHFLLRKNSG